MESLFSSFLSLKAPYQIKLVAPVLPNKQIASVDAGVRVLKTDFWKPAPLRHQRDQGQQQSLSTGEQLVIMN